MNPYEIKFRVLSSDIWLPAPIISLYSFSSLQNQRYQTTELFIVVWTHLTISHAISLLLLLQLEYSHPLWFSHTNLPLIFQKKVYLLREAHPALQVESNISFFGTCSTTYRFLILYLYNFSIHLVTCLFVDSKIFTDRDYIFFFLYLYLESFSWQ